MKKIARLSALLITLAVITLWGSVAPPEGLGRTPSTAASESGERTLSPYFFVKSEDSTVDQMPLKATSAKVTISGVIADVQVTQIYKNEGRKTLEALYVFPGLHKGGGVRDEDDHRHPGHRGEDREAGRGPPGHTSRPGTRGRAPPFLNSRGPTSSR